MRSAPCGATHQKGRDMKYVVQVEIDPVSGLELEWEAGKIQSWIATWQALNPIGMYFSLTRRAVTIIVDVPNEDAMFEAIHASWVLPADYPEGGPVATG